MAFRRTLARPFGSGRGENTAQQPDEQKNPPPPPETPEQPPETTPSARPAARPLRQVIPRPSPSAAPMPIKTRQHLPSGSSSRPPQSLLPSRQQLEPPDWLNSAWTEQLQWTKDFNIDPEVRGRVKQRLQAVEVESENKPCTEVIALYGKIMREYLNPDPKSWSSSEGFTIHSTIKELLRSCYRLCPQIAVALKAAEERNEQKDLFGREEFLSVGYIFAEILKGIEPPDSLELSLAFDTLAQSLCKFTSALAAAEALYLRAVEQIERNSCTDVPEAESVRQHLATFYIEHLFGRNQGPAFVPIQSWADQEQLIGEVLAGMESRLGEDHPDVANFLHKLGNRYMDAGMEDEAEEAFGEALARRKKGLGPYHRDALESGESLRNLYLGQERYLEVDALLRASLDPDKVTPTSTVSDAYTFWRWYQEDNGLQGQLATLKVPGESLYWEDSRIYLNEITEVNLIHTSTPDPFPRVPLKIIVCGDHLEVEIPQTYLESTAAAMGFETKDQVVSHLQNTDIWCILSSRASRLDWSCFQTNAHRIISEEVRPEWWGRSEQMQDMPLPKSFWISPEDQIPVLEENKLQDQAHRLLWCKYLQECKWNPNMKSDSGYQPRDLYIFERVESSSSDWMVIGVQPGNGDCIDPQRDDTSADISRTNLLPSGFITNQHRYYAQEELKPRNMEYSIKQNMDKSISLTLPYMSYAGFKRTRGYQHGLFYEDYFRALMCLIHRPKYRTGDAFLELRCRMFTGVEEQRINNHILKFKMPSMQEPKPTTTLGLFNGIPGDSAVIDNQESLKGFSFVSSEWAEWKRLTLHNVLTDSTPQLKASDGQPIFCHGYISGTWTSLDLTASWFGLRLFVVDAVFLIQGSEQEHHFLFAPESFTKENHHQLSSCEKRFTCGALNPSLFRYEFPRLVWLGSVFKRMGKGKDQAPRPTTELDFWDEMNRREKWDRAFEKKIRTASARSTDSGEVIAKEKLELERQEEDKRRLEWDAQQAKQRIT